MNCFKALISKHGAILSIEEREEIIDDDPRIDLLPGSKFPDVICVNADNKEDAEQKVNDLLSEYR